MKERRPAATDDGTFERGTPGLDFRLALPTFEGPLELLLHLIREHRVDIFDIPIALITEKYLEHLEQMREVNLDIAGEFLVMAATLAHIKSRLLLPRQELAASAAPDAEPSGALDPRSELVKRLLEYQKYRTAASSLGERPLLGRDVFARTARPPVRLGDEDREGPLAELSVYKLIRALDTVLKRLAPRIQHEVIRERLSLSATIQRILARMKESPEVSFFSLLSESPSPPQVIIHFLAVLEMCKLRLVRLEQEDGEADIRLTAGPRFDEGTCAPEVDEREYR